MKDTITTPFSTATPDSAMKPTAAEIENGMPRRSSAATPPGQRQRNPGEHDRGIRHRAEQEEEEREDQQQRERHDELQGRLAAEIRCSKVPP